MTKTELLQLEELLTKYHSEVESPLGLSISSPCLSMVREKLYLIEKEYSLENQSMEQQRV